MQNEFSNGVIVGVYLTNLTIWGLHIILALLDGNYTSAVVALAVIAILSALAIPVMIRGDKP